MSAIRGGAVAITGLSLLGLSLLGVFGLELFCETTLRLPRRQAPLDPNWETVRIDARDGAMLEGSWIQTNTSSHRCVLMVPGIGASRADMHWFVPTFYRHNYKILITDDRAQGASGGSLVTYGLLEKFDAIDWAHWMQRQGCSSVYGLGESMGASILIQAAEVEPVFRSIAAECAFSDLRPSAEAVFRELVPLPAWLAKPVSRGAVGIALQYARLRYGVDLRQVSPVRSIAHTQTPVLLIHGTKDRKTPYWHSQALAQAGPKASLWLVPEAGHVSAHGTQPEEFERRVLQFFD